MSNRPATISLFGFLNQMGPMEVLVVVGVPALLATLALPIWGIIDAAGRPDVQWTTAGQSKGLWIALMAVGTVFRGAGIVLSIVYLAAIRPKLEAARGGGGEIGKGRFDAESSSLSGQE